MLGLLVMRWKKTNYYKPYKVILTSRDLDATKVEHFVEFVEWCVEFVEWCIEEVKKNIFVRKENEL